MENPWYVDSIEAFACLKCPECVFNTKENKVFQNHAVEKHPLSHVLFGAPKTVSNSSIVVLNYDPNDIEKYIKENANMLQYSIANSSEVSLIKEELSEKTYFVEQVSNESNESNQLNFSGQSLTEVLESNIENQTVVHMTNIDKETIFEKNPALALKKEDCENSLTEKTQCETLSEIAHDKEQLDTDLLQDPNEVVENMAPFDEKTKKFSCSKCDKTFAKKGNVKYHFAKVHQQKGKSRIRCKYCTSPILSQADLELHVLSVHGGKKPECTVCNEIFHKESDLIIHLREVHAKKISYNCHICGAKCAKKAYLRQHIETVHEKKKPFKCNLCDYSASTPQILNVHVSSAHEASLDERRKFPCPICNKKFTQQNAIKGHILAVHEKVKPFKCTICDHSFAGKGDLTKHMNCVHKGMKPYACNNCDRKFYTKNNLLKHFEKEHDGKEPTDETKFSCKYCSCKILSQADLEKHFLSIHGGKKPECTKCNITFLRETTLIRHKRKIHGEKMIYRCHICNKKNRKDTMLTHIETVHEGNKPYKCHLCDSSFSSKTTLNGHISSVHGVLIGTKIKAWPCEECDKSFTVESNLKIHVASVHEGKKLFKCITCDFTSAYNEDLTNHIAAVHDGIKPNDSSNDCVKFRSDILKDKKLLKQSETALKKKGQKWSCEKCDQTFSFKNALDKHVAVVHEKKLKCTLCVFTSELSIDLKNHMSSNHGGQKPVNCAICFIYFEKKIKLQKHLEEAHGKKVPLDSL